MRRIRWQILIAIGGLLLILALLMQQAPEPGTPELLPQKGGSYVEGVVGSIVRLNPVLDFANPPDRDVDRLLYSGLIRFDSRGIPQPDLAESWAVSADATLYTFTLRPDATWHDGIPVTADDVIYTFSKLQDEDYPGPDDLKELWSEINIIRLDDRNVQFQLPEPFAPFMDYLALALLPEHLLRGVSAGDLVDHPFNLQPVGTGPFRFDRFLAEAGEITGVSLTANPDHYLQPPYLERVEFRVYDSQETAWEALQRGEIQGLGGLEGEVLAEALSAEGVNLHTARLPMASLVYLNTQHPEKTFLTDKRVRQALLYAVNRQWMIDRVDASQALLADGPILPGTWAYSESGLRPDFDPTQAASQLEQAGWVLPTGATPGSPEYVRAKEDLQLAFTLVHPDDERHTRLAEAMRQYWAAIGVSVDLKAVDAEALLKDYLEPREFEAALADLNFLRSPDPDPYPFWHDSQVETGQNYSDFADRNISIWLEQARTTPDLGRRADLYESFQHRFRDQVPALLLSHPVYTLAIRSDIQGVTLGPLFDASDRLANIAQWYLIARRSAQPEPATPTPGS
jgi:peptide/nickel transport system substrate-binding protein